MLVRMVLVYLLFSTLSPPRLNLQLRRALLYIYRINSRLPTIHLTLLWPKVTFTSPACHSNLSSRWAFFSSILVTFLRGSCHHTTAIMSKIPTIIGATIQVIRCINKYRSDGSGSLTSKIFLL